MRSKQSAIFFLSFNKNTGSEREGGVMAKKKRKKNERQLRGE
jgi:hypothetical protein